MVEAAVAKAMQQAVVDLNALALRGKQMHWNLQGKNFLTLHVQLDTIVDFARTSYDDFAERLVAIGGAPDALPQTIADQTHEARLHHHHRGLRAGGKGSERRGRRND